MSVVDVLVPSYNYARFLRAAVESALQPGAPPTRVLIIDDCSTDDTPAVAQALCAQYPSVSYVRHEKNIGHISTYNEGIMGWAKSPYFVLLSADDMLAPGATARAVAFLDAHPDVGLLYGRTHMFNEAPAPDLGISDTYDTNVIDGLEFARSVFATTHQPVYCPASVIVRTDLQKALGGYLHALPHAGDMEMYVRFALHANIGYLDVVQGLYRLHSSNMSRGYRELRDYHQRLLVFETLCREFGHRFPDHASWHRSACQTMAHELFWTAANAFDRGQRLDVSGYLALAASIDPSITKQPSWRHLRLKRLLGRPLAACASSLITRCRSMQAGGAPVEVRHQ
jgi:glycosyltransferase involved in cell wall biosynthesis